MKTFSLYATFFSHQQLKYAIHINSKKKKLTKLSSYHGRSIIFISNKRIFNNILMVLSGIIKLQQRKLFQTPWENQFKETNRSFLQNKKKYK